MHYSKLHWLDTFAPFNITKVLRVILRLRLLCKQKTIILIVYINTNPLSKSYRIDLRPFFSYGMDECFNRLYLFITSLVSGSYLSTYSQPALTILYVGFFFNSTRQTLSYWCHGPNDRTKKLHILINIHRNLSYKSKTLVQWVQLT